MPKKNWVSAQLLFLSRALFGALCVLLAVLFHASYGNRPKEIPAYSILFPKGDVLSADALHTRFFPYADTMSMRPSYPGAFDPFYSSFIYSPKKPL